ncbi:MAG TPA: CHAT domain-containing protein [Actinomycetota bacterium]|nr:CHAT domain-containing protein [Actinomycetota bacterium]
MGDISYQDFDLLIERAGDGYRVRVQVEGRESRRDFALPEGLPVMGKLVEQLAGRRARGEAGDAPSGDGLPGGPQPLATLGTSLYRTIFDDEVRDVLKGALSRFVGPSAGLRIRLRLDAPELVGVAWELLCDPASMRFPALSEKTPLVRYLDLADPRAPLPVTAPLRVLVLISNPSGVPELDVESEWTKLKEALRAPLDAGKVELERVQPPTLPELRSRLLHGEYHVFHFVGHGGFNPRAGEGFLLFEGPDRGRADVSGDDLGTWLADHFPLRLAVLNACEGGETSEIDPFAGVAQRLVQQGTPAVIAMQCAITDEAAITFSESFYQALATGRPLEAAVATGRKAVRTDVSPTEWATPVLYSRLPDGSLFEMEEPSAEQLAMLRDDAVLQEFWNPTGASSATLFFGTRPMPPSKEGEVEPVVGLPYATGLGEIRQFLVRVFGRVTVTDDPDQIDPAGVLVALGGPLTNPMTADIVAQSTPPIWFLGLPYTAGQERSVGTELDVYKPLLGEGRLTADVGVAVRVIPAGGAARFVIAGCYGAGTLGVARVLMTAESVRTFGPVKDVPRFQVVTRSFLTGWDVARSEILTTRRW